MNFFLKGIWTLAKKEWAEAFASPLIYLLATPFCLLLGWIFFQSLLQAETLTARLLDGLVLAPLYGVIHIMFLFLAPLLSMRLLSEENRAGTLELLLSSRLSSWQIVLGKFLGCLMMLAFLLALTGIFPLILAALGHFNFSMLAGGYLGVFLVVGAYMAVGLWTSSWTQNQIVAAFASFCLLAGLALLALMGQNTDNFALAQLAQYLSTPLHLESFLTGGIRSYSLVYLFSLCAFFLYLTHLTLESRRW